jgi:peptidyl-Asp metalloendopeptidase
MRDAAGADIAILIVGGNQDACGLARQFPSADDAFATVFTGNKCLNSNNSLIHEIGHIFGAHHDIENVEGGATQFAYGHGEYIIDSCTHSIMSFAHPCPLYGNPTNTTGRVLGFTFPANFAWSTVTSMGNAYTANNVRVLKEQAEKVSNFRRR